MKKSNIFKDPNKTQVGGDHYENKQIQPWDFIISNDLGFLEGNIIKYVCRWKEKNGLEDLEKAQHYLNKLMSVVSDNKKRKAKRSLTNLIKK